MSKVIEELEKIKQLVIKEKSLKTKVGKIKSEQIKLRSELMKLIPMGETIKIGRHSVLFSSHNTTVPSIISMREELSRKQFDRCTNKRVLNRWVFK